MDKMKFLNCFVALLLAVTILLSEAARAEDKPSVYSPEKCQFSVTFPGEPYTTKRCDDENKNKCYNQTSYTKVFDMQATVNFRVICNPIGQDVYDNYSAEVMEATLRAMTDKNTIKTYDTSYRDSNGYKQAGLVGEGLVGKMSTIYIAQLWIADGSALSVEAELLGDANDKADVMFKDVLKSIHFVTEEEKKVEAEKSADNAQTENTDEKATDEKAKDDKKEPE